MKKRGRPAKEKATNWVVKNVFISDDTRLGIERESIHLIDESSSGVGERKTFCGKDYTESVRIHEAVDCLMTNSELSLIKELDCLCPFCRDKKEENEVSNSLRSLEMVF